MGSFRAMFLILVTVFVLPSFVSIPHLRAQEDDRIWGRITTVSGDVLEGFIRWDRNEGSWVDRLDGSKEMTPFQYQEWWRLAHPEDEGG